MNKEQKDNWCLEHFATELAMQELGGCCKEIIIASLENRRR